MATNSLGQLTLDLVARTQGFVQGMDKAERRSKKWRRQVERDLRRLRGQFANMAKVAAGAGAAAAGAFTIMAKEGLQYVDAQAKMARQLGASIDGLRGLQIAANDAGVDTQTLNGAVDRMNARLGEARQGSGQAYEALNRLGLAADDLAKMDADQRIAVIADRVQELGLDSADTANLLRDLGIRNREMVNLLMAGGDSIRAARKEVDEYGLSLSEVDAAKVEQANDAFSRIPRLLEPIKTSIAVNLAEPLEGVSKHILEASKETEGFRDQVGGMTDSVVDGLLFIIDAGDGVKRVFELAGAGLALMVIEGQRDLAKLAESIYSGPIDAINALIQQMNRIPGIDLGPVQQFDFVEDLQGRVAQFTRAAEIARQDMQDILMAPMASEGFRQAIETARNPPTLGGEGVGMLSTAAIDASNQVAASLDRLTEATEGTTESEEDKNDETEETTRAVKALGDASTTASRALAGMGGWGRGAYGSPGGSQENSGSSVRDRIEAGKDLGAYWLEPNPNAKPNWSTDYAPAGFLETAAQVNSHGAYSSISAMSAGQVQGQGAARNMGQITLSLKTDSGEESASGEISESLVSLLEQAAAGASAR